MAVLRRSLNTQQPSEPSPEFKAFYMRVVPVAMRYAVQHAPFPVAQDVTQRTMSNCLAAGAGGVEDAEFMIGKNAPVLYASLAVGIVKAWRRDRRPGGTRAEPPRHISPDELKLMVAHVRRNAILSSMELVSKRSGNDTMSRLSPAEIDEMPLDPQVAGIIDYFMHEMGAVEEAAFEHRLGMDPDFFEKVSPVAMMWVWPGAVLGPSDGEEWRPERAMGDGKGGRDYRIPERGLELMWRRLCEVVSSA